MKSRDYYFREPDMRKCKDAVKLANNRVHESRSLDELAQLARDGVAQLRFDNLTARGVYKVVGDHA